MFDETEPWETSVPADLIQAIKYLRKSFDDIQWGCGQTTKVFCYSRLHAEEVDDHSKQHFNYLMYTKARIGPAATARFHDLVKQGTPPAIFKAFFDLYCDGVSVEALRIFQELSEIGRANQRSLGVPFLDWAEAQTRHVVRAHSHLVNIWIRDVCDKQVYDPNDDDDEHWFWRKWQAPKLLLMTPSRGKPYEPAAIWERYDPPTSSRFLNAFARDYVHRIEARVRKASGQAALALAKEPTGPRTDSGASAEPTSSQSTSVTDAPATTPRVTTDPEQSDPQFSHTEDYRSLRFRGEAYTLTTRQAVIVELLHRAYLSGYADVPKAKLLGAVEAETSEVRDSFRGSPLWKTLIRTGSRRGTYRLAVGDGQLE